MHTIAIHDVIGLDGARRNNVENSTLIPVFVASRTASSRGSYTGLKAMVKAQSIIRPVS